MQHQQSYPKNQQIDSLDVSNSWKNRFYLIERAGGVKRSKIKELQFKERIQVILNIPALILGPIYFLRKGLWKQTLTYMGIIVFTAIFFTKFLLAILATMIATFGTRANIGYYSKKVLSNQLWF